MFKGLYFRRLILALLSLTVVINTNVAYSKQSAEGAVPVIKQSKTRKPKPQPKSQCKKNRNQCNVISPQGNTPASQDPPTSISIGCPGNPPPIPITRPELKNVTCAVAINKLEALKASGKATSDDYLLLGYFYNLEEKYDKSQANYFTAFELTTNDAKKAIIEQELQKIDAATLKVKPVDK